MIDMKKKVLMVVDNGITGDSRVQKSATAIAARNYQVILLGIDTGEKLPKLGDVEIVRLPLSDQEDSRPELTSRLLSRILFPFAFRSQKHLLASRENVGRLVNNAKKSGSKYSRSGLSARLEVKLAKWLHAFRKLVYQRKGSYEKRRAVKSLLTGDKTPVNKRYEDTFINYIVNFSPDFIHVHDYKSISVGAIATEQLRSLGKSVKLIYDAHEFLPGLTQYSPEWLARQCENESQYIAKADCVVTVSSEIADLLVETHSLPRSPIVVLNAPAVLDAENSERDLRNESNVSDEALLGLYVGGVTPIRGLNVIIPALDAIPHLHVTLLTRNDKNVAAMQSEAYVCGVGERLHVVEYVSPNEIVPFISKASFGIAPYLHMLNQEISLPSKFYEYACARLPIVGSDVAVVKSVLERTSVGEVFEAGNEESFIEAVLKISNGLESYRDNYNDSEFKSCTWEAQSQILADTYAWLESTG